MEWSDSGLGAKTKAPVEIHSRLFPGNALVDLEVTLCMTRPKRKDHERLENFAV